MAKFRKKNNILGAWQYILLDILYIIPIIGIIMAIVHACDSNNENRQHYARAFFARLLFIVLLLGIGAGILYIYLGHSNFFTTINNIYRVFTQSIDNFIALF